MQDTQPISDQTVTVESPSNNAKWVIAIIGMALIGFGVGYLANSFIVTTPPSSSIPQPTENAVVVPSTEGFDFEPFSDNLTQNFPVNVNNILYSFSVEDGSVKEIKKNVGSLGGSLGYGTFGYLFSPDLTKVAVIDEDNNLTIHSSDGSQVREIESSLNAYALTGWSPDSTKLIISAMGSPTIIDGYIPNGPVDPDTILEEQTFEKSSVANGFYLLDLDNGTTSYLGVLDGIQVYDWIDNQTLLLFSPNYPNEMYFSFNLQTYTSSSNLTDVFDGLFSTQTSIARDTSTKKWALGISPDGIDEQDATSRVVLATYPSIEGEVIAEGRFASVQSPHISPDGKKVLYRKYDVLNGPNYIELYMNGQSQRLFEGLTLAWVDDNRFIYGVYPKGEENNSNDGAAEKYYQYDLTTRQSTLMHEANRSQE